MSRTYPVGWWANSSRRGFRALDVLENERLTGHPSTSLFDFWLFGVEYVASPPPVSVIALATREAVTRSFLKAVVAGRRDRYMVSFTWVAWIGDNGGPWSWGS